MNESFDKFKKRIWLGIIVKCVLAALCCAFLIVNIVLFSCLLNGVHLLWVWYLLIALAGFAVGGGVAFLCFRTDDGKIAKRLDAELSLSERVQTAYVYRDSGGVMLDLQRSDAETALSNTPNKLGFGNFIVTIILAVALAIGVGALPVIAVYADTSKNTPSGTVPPKDPPRDVTDWEWQALDELIEYVRSSKKADEAAKSGMVTALTGLRNILLGGVSQNSLTVFVRNTVTEIRNAVTAANEHDGVTDEQKQNNSDEEEYVINRLNEIFGLSQSGGSDPSGGGEQNPEQPVSPGNNTGTGELIINGLPFFDPELGYVSSGDTETRDKYYAIIQQAMLEGTISRSEWELIVAKYFSDFKESENNEEN
ncbi:MAG: hypothetical protein HDT28_01340 [Clostridiales bacterium]|nr:hypothetical protein [Clostridiales bacterium]